MVRLAQSASLVQSASLRAESTCACASQSRVNVVLVLICVCDPVCTNAIFTLIICIISNKHMYLCDSECVQVPG